MSNNFIKKQTKFFYILSLFIIVIMGYLIFSVKIIWEEKESIENISYNLQEVEINIFELGQSIEKYILYDTSKRNILRIEDSQEDILRYLDNLMNDEFINTLKIKRPLYQIKYKIEKLIDISDSIQKIYTTKKINFQLLRKYINDMDKLLAKKIRGESFSKKEFQIIFKLEVNLAKMVRELGIYLKSNSNKNLSKIHSLKKEINNSIWALDSLNTSKEFKIWLMKVKKLEKTKFLIIQKIVELNEKKMILLKKLDNNLSFIDYQLDNVIEKFFNQKKAEEKRKYNTFLIVLIIVVLLVIGLLGQVFYMIIYFKRKSKNLKLLTLNLDSILNKQGHLKFKINDYKDDDIKKLSLSLDRIENKIKTQAKANHKLKTIVNALGNIQFVINSRNQITDGTKDFYNILGYSASKINTKNFFFSYVDFNVSKELEEKGLFGKTIFTMHNYKNVPYYTVLNALKLNENEILFYSKYASSNKNDMDILNSHGYIILDLSGAVINFNLVLAEELGLSLKQIKGVEFSTKLLDSDENFTMEDIKNILDKNSYIKVGIKKRVYCLYAYSINSSQNPLVKYFIKFKKINCL